MWVVAKISPLFFTPPTFILRQRPIWWWEIKRKVGRTARDQKNKRLKKVGVKAQNRGLQYRESRVTTGGCGVPHTTHMTPSHRRVICAHIAHI